MASYFLALVVRPRVLASTELFIQLSSSYMYCLLPGLFVIQNVQADVFVIVRDGAEFKNKLMGVMVYF